MNPVRMLLVESAPDQAVLLREVLEEAQEFTPGGSWAPFEITYVEALEDARDVAAAQPLDLILFDPALPAIAPLTAFTELRSATTGTPLIVLITRGDELLAHRMLREGAQDYIVKEEIDCGPLARAIRNAIERQRYLNAMRSGCVFDELTGLYNDRGFENAAARELHLAAASGQSLLLVLAEIDNLADLTAAYGREQHDMTLLDAADVLRETAGGVALLACLERKRFAALVWNARREEFISRVQTCHASHPRPYAFTFGWSVTHPGAVESVDPLISSAQASLCENKQSYEYATNASLSMPHTASATASRA